MKSKPKKKNTNRNFHLDFQQWNRDLEELVEEWTKEHEDKGKYNKDNPKESVRNSIYSNNFRYFVRFKKK